MQLPGVTGFIVNPSHGLDVNSVAILAVLYNPDLRAYRTRAGVASAQLFSARLLPDPTLTVAGAVPTAGPPPLTNAISGTLGYTFTSLITRGDRIAVARSNLRAVDLDVVWQEWQVAQQARLYFVDLWYDDRERTLLLRYRRLYLESYRRAERALKQGNTTIDVAGDALVGLLDSDTRLNTLEQSINTVEHQLKAELGLNPTMMLRLAPGGEAVHVPMPAHIRQAMSVMPERRPDLVGLRWGYQSQEARVREAILAQFPPLDIGITYGRDTAATVSGGGNIAIGLPIFNRNRGAIAIERATRAQLRAEYQARIDADYGTADKLRVQASVIDRELDHVRAELPRIESTAKAAETAFSAHNLPAATYLLLQTSALNKQIEAITLERSLAETAIALDTVLGEPVKTAAGS